MIQFWVPGKPQPQGSKTVRPVYTKTGKFIKSNVVEDNDELKPWRERVAIVAHNAMKGRGLIIGPVALEMQFVLHRPASTPLRGRPAIKKPDADKLERAICDALTGVCIAADAQVVWIAATKRLAEVGEPLGVRIWLAELNATQTRHLTGTRPGERAQLRGLLARELAAVSGGDAGTGSQNSLVYE